MRLERARAMTVGLSFVVGFYLVCGALLGMAVDEVRRWRVLRR